MGDSNVNKVMVNTLDHVNIRKGHEIIISKW